MTNIFTTTNHQIGHGNCFLFQMNASHVQLYGLSQPLTGMKLTNIYNITFNYGKYLKHISHNFSEMKHTSNFSDKERQNVIRKINIVKRGSSIFYMYNQSNTHQQLQLELHLL